MKNPISENQLNMFGTPREKGGHEWSSFSAVREDRVGMYRVAQPQKPLVARSEHNVLRIIRPHNSGLRGAY